MRTWIAAVALSLLVACGGPPLPPPGQLGKLVVAIGDDPSEYQVDSRGRPSGFTHDLVVLFAQELGVEARFIPAPAPADAAKLLDRGRAHLAAASLAPAAHPDLRFTQPFDAGRQIPFHPEDLQPFDAAGESGSRSAAASAWAFPANGDASLPQRAEAFLERIRRDGTLERLADRYFGHAHRLSAGEVEHFLERMQSVLPRYRRLFIEAQDVHGIDWRLLAALAYQESHWDPLATSPTGVRGFMMLTEETADRLAVKNRLDARESILGGARYLGLLAEALPPRIQEPDRTWLALAAYNLGIGHLEDARILAQRKGLSPDTWQDVKLALPGLADPATYQKLKHGYARGHEAMQFVDNVRNFHDILDRVQPREFALPPRRSIDPQAPAKGSLASR